MISTENEKGKSKGKDEQCSLRPLLHLWIYASFSKGDTEPLYLFSRM